MPPSASAFLWMASTCALLDAASATMTPFPTVARLSSNGLMTDTIGVLGAVRLSTTSRLGNDAACADSPNCMAIMVRSLGS